MKQNRIELAIEILDYAIVDNTSAKNACKILGYGKNYVSNIRSSFILPKNDEEKRFYTKYTEYENLRKKPNLTTSTFTTTTHYKPQTIEPKQKESDKFLVEENDTEKTIEWGGTNYSSDHIKTLDELLTATKTDLKLWNVKNHVVNKWDTTFVDNNKNPRTIQNYQVKATLEKNVAQQKNILASEVFKEMLSNYNPPTLYISKESLEEIETTENNLLEISLFDLHLGKLAHSEETGEDYNIKIASERFITAIKKLINQAESFNFNRILFPIGNDFFNTDNQSNTTSKGTPQDESSLWFNSYSIGVKLLVDAIMLLKQTGVPVDVLIISGNHDRQRAYYMGEHLSAWFHNDDQVNINNGPSTRKYYKFGKVLLGFTHGDEEKESSLPMLMATDMESKPVWGETNYHEFHLGHQHRKRGFKYSVNRDTMFNEELGVIIRYLSSLSSADSWHHTSGYIGAIKAAEAFIWSAEYGMIAHLNVNINL